MTTFFIEMNDNILNSHTVHGGLELRIFHGRAIAPNHCTSGSFAYLTVVYDLIVAAKLGK